MNRFFKIYFVISIMLIVSFCVYANVQKRTKPALIQYKFDLKAGDRLIVIDASAEKSYIRITPPEARILNLTIQEGKTLGGILTQHNK